MYIPVKEDFPLRRGDIEVWGYIRVYQDRKAHQRILTLQIREKEFLKIAEQIAPVSCDWYEIISCFRKKNPVYLHSSRTARMPGIGTEGKTLILKADQLNFLSPEVNEMILSAYLLNGFSVTRMD